MNTPKFSGSRTTADLVDNFYVVLTPESMAAVSEAKTTVASKWRSSFETRWTAGGPQKMQANRRRCFKRVAKVVNQQTKKKSADKDSKVKKNAMKKKKEKVVGKIKENGLDEHRPENYSRSEKGSRLIRQAMQRLLNADKIAFPDKPMFEEQTDFCRLKFLGL